MNKELFLNIINRHGAVPAVLALLNIADIVVKPSISDDPLRVFRIVTDSFVSYRIAFPKGMTFMSLHPDVDDEVFRCEAVGSGACYEFANDIAAMVRGGILLSSLVNKNYSDYN